MRAVNHASLRRGAGVIVALTAALSVSACTGGSGESATSTPTTTPASTSTPAPTLTTSAATTESPTRTDKPAEKETTTQSRKGFGGTDKEDLDKARTTFASVTPESLWDKISECSTTTSDHDFACSGREVGQFQFYSSQTKAATTTELLRNLRGSKMIKDTGRFVIGWSVSGTSAILSVVDNDEGLVMQQLLATDQVEPDEWAKQLHLDQPAGMK